MITKIKIGKYGPFDEVQELDLGDKYPCYIIGLNDVGKTCLLSAIAALKIGIKKKYITNGEKLNIKIELKIEEKDYEKDLKNELKEKFGEFFEGKFKVDVDDKIGEKMNIPIQNLEKGEVNEFIKSKILPKINELKKKNVNPFKTKDILENFIDIKQNILHNKEKIFDTLIKVFNKFKTFLFEQTKKIHFLKVRDDSEWNFIKDCYSTRKIDDGDLKNEKAGTRELLDKIVGVFAPKHAKKFKEIIDSDRNYDDKQRDLDAVTDAIDENFNEFMKNHFPSEQQVIKSKFNYSPSDNFEKIMWNMYDVHSERAESKRLNVNKRSEGFKWFLKLYFIVRQAKSNDTILIDEPEKYLHIKTQEKFIQLASTLIEEKNIKFVFVTHSPWIMFNRSNPKILDISNVSVLTKENGKCKIYRIDNLMRSSENEHKEPVSILETALGFNYFEFMKLKGFDKEEEKIVFVERYSDILVWEIACLISDHQELIKRVKFWPLYGDTKLYNVGLANVLQLKFVIFLDGTKEDYQVKNNKIEVDDNFVFLGDKMRDYKVSNPEDILNFDKLKSHGLNKKNHFFFWNSIYEEFKKNKSFFETEEIKKLKEYFKIIKNISGIQMD